MYFLLHLGESGDQEWTDSSSGSDNWTTMRKTLLIQDKSATGILLKQLQLDVDKEEISVAELIKYRVRQEMGTLEEESSQPVYTKMYFDSLRLKQRLTARLPDEKTGYVSPLHNFQKYGFYIVINNRQVDSLDEVIRLDSAPLIYFVEMWEPNRIFSLN